MSPAESVSDGMEVVEAVESDLNVKDQETELGDALKLLGPVGQGLDGVGAQLGQETPDQSGARSVARSERVGQAQEVFGEPFQGLLENGKNNQGMV